MAKILEFKAPKRKAKKSTKSPAEKPLTIMPMAKKPQKQKKPGNALCREGHHKWEVDNSTDFAVKKGRLVTVYRCKHCGITKIKSE